MREKLTLEVDGNGFKMMTIEQHGKKQKQSEQKRIQSDGQF
jgi:hypothetical protein